MSVEEKLGIRKDHTPNGKFIKTFYFVYLLDHNFIQVNVPLLKLFYFFSEDVKYFF